MVKGKSEVELNIICLAQLMESVEPEEIVSTIAMICGKNPIQVEQLLLTATLQERDEITLKTSYSNAKRYRRELALREIKTQLTKI